MMKTVVFAALLAAGILGALIFCGVIGWLIGRSNKINEKLWKKPEGKNI